MHSTHAGRMFIGPMMMLSRLACVGRSQRCCGYEADSFVEKPIIGDESTANSIGLLCGPGGLPLLGGCVIQAQYLSAAFRRSKLFSHASIAADKMASKTIVLAAAIFLIICLVEPSTSECTLPCQIHPTRGSCACPADVGRKRRDVKEEDINGRRRFRQLHDRDGRVLTLWSKGSRSRPCRCRPCLYPEKSAYPC